MKTWVGCAAICVNDQQDILMVKSYDTNAWALPSGGLEAGETPEECCVREVREETGYPVIIVERLHTKETTMKGIHVTTHDYKVRMTGESQGIQDLDQTIAAFAWKPLSQIEQMKHVYPEDIDFLVKMVQHEGSGDFSEKN
ncbi:NUDIX hydrolase [Bacillaceae bacterium SIJ1]|uniref:NUDIX hydrolase n=1 Tax=Litoribacterium kuwaitense TaxID=1398745 RepID=UPI0013ECC6DA|nr:NUDIX hydrolase [Litoribacterium kuwaitense]NGP46472.1 NUDIX hydrolase [Litoribacterium kuwaitense]